MSETTVRHDTVAVTRSFKATAARVFRAWQDPAALQRWYTPGDETWSAKILEHDFRVGGKMRTSFGPRGGTPHFEDCLYVDIVPDRRICYAMSIAAGDTRITVSMVTVEFLARGQRTEVSLTDQVAILDGGDTAKAREQGWGETLAKLEAELAA